MLCGLPPKDLWEDVSQAWIRAGLNVDDCWKRTCSVTNEWVYEAGAGPLKSRIKQRFSIERSIPLKNRTLAEVLNPQPEASLVMKRLLDWIDRVDMASQTGLPRPAFETEEGEHIFPEGDEPWWLTDLSRRIAPEEKMEGDEDGPPSDVEEVVEEQQAEVTDSDASCEPENSSRPPSAPFVPFVAWEK